MNALIGGGKKQSQGGLGGLASSFLGSGSSGSHGSSGGHSSGGAGGIVGALAGSLLGGGKKPNSAQQSGNYSGAQQPQQHQSGAAGMMGSVTGMFGGQHGQVC